MRVKTILWFVAFTFFVATVIDIVDGYIPKIINSLLMAFSFVFFATGYGRKEQKKYFVRGYGLLLLAIAVLVYRLITWYTISN
jgi:hypothetical protein